MADYDQRHDSHSRMWFVNKAHPAAIIGGAILLIAALLLFVALRLGLSGSWILAVVATLILVAVLLVVILNGRRVRAARDEQCPESSVKGEHNMTSELAWMLNYVIETDPKITGKDRAGRRSQVGLGLWWDGVLIERREEDTKTDWALMLEHRSGRRRFRDRTSRRSVECDLGRGGLTRVLESLPPARLRTDGTTRVLRLGESEFACAHVFFDSGDTIVEAWTAQLAGVSPASVRLAWASLTGHRISEPAIRHGVPLEVVVRRRTNLATPATRMEAQSIARVPDAAFADKRGFELVRQARFEVPQGRHGKGVVPASPSASGLPLIQFSAAGDAPDFAWLPRQRLLDRVREVVNKAARLFGTFSGTHSPEQPSLHLDPIDWWTTISDGLTSQGMRTVDALLRTLLGLRIIKEEQIASMTDEQRQDYERAIREAHHKADETRARGGDDADAKAERARMVHMVSFLISQEIDSLTNLAYEETRQERAPYFFKATDRDGNPLSTIRGTIEADGISMGYRADEFDLTISFGNRDNLERLEFRDGALSVGLALSRITVDFHFLTWSNISLDEDSDRDDTNSPFAPVTNTLHVVGELAGEAGKAFLLANEGHGRLTIENPLVTIDLSSAPPVESPAPGDPAPPAIGLASSYNRDLSSMTVSLDLSGFNLAMEVITTVFATQIGEQFRLAISDAIADAVKDIAQGLDLAEQWPEAWHTEDGPDMTPASAASQSLWITSGAAHLLGRLAARESAGALRQPGALDAGQVNFSGVAVSRAYLAAWLRARMTRGERRGEGDPQVPLRLDVPAFETELGVVLPRGSAEKDDSVRLGEHNRRRRSTPARRRRYIVVGGVAYELERIENSSTEVLPEFTAERSMDVVLPDGESPVACTAQIVYHVLLGLWRHDVRASTVLELPDSQFVDPRQLGGAHGDPVAGLRDRPANVFINEETEVIDTYLEARARITFPLVFGLKEGLAEPVLPMLTLAIPEDAALEFSFENVSVAAPLTDNDALRDYLKRVVQADAEKFLAPLRNEAYIPVVSNTLESPIEEDLEDFLVFRQVGAEPHDAFRFVCQNGWVYWSWEWIDRFDEWFRP